MRSLTRHVIVQAIIVAGLSFVVYFRTLAPSIIAGDSAELTAAAWVGGVPHPSGYPLYTMIGYVFTHVLPLGSVAFRMNLLSAIFASAGIGFAYLVARLLLQRRSYSAIAALLFAFSGTFWSQAVTAEVYAAHLFFVTASLFCVLGWDRTGKSKWLQACALVIGFSFTHHLQTVLLLPALIYLLVTSRYREQVRSNWKSLSVLVFAPLILWLYLPLAAARNPPVNWGDPLTLERFVYHATGRQYAHFMGIDSLATLRERTWHYIGPVVDHGNPGYLQSQFSLPLLIIGLVGFVSLFRVCRRTLLFTATYYLSVVGWALWYGIPDVEVYFISAHLIVAIWIGAGLRQSSQWLSWVWRRLTVPVSSQRRLSRALGVVMGALPLLLIFLNWQGNDYSKHVGDLKVMHAVYDRLEPNAILVAGGDTWEGPLQYVAFVERRRPDVALLGFEELSRRSRLRVALQARSRGVIVNLPPGYGNIPANSPNVALLSTILFDNLPQRPIFAVGDDMEKLFSRPEIKAMHPEWSQTVPGQPLFKLIAHPAAEKKK
jgi:hypothetical protein